MVDVVCVEVRVLVWELVLDVVPVLVLLLVLELLLELLVALVSSHMLERPQTHQPRVVLCICSPRCYPQQKVEDDLLNGTTPRPFHQLEPSGTLQKPGAKLPAA